MAAARFRVALRGVVSGISPPSPWSPARRPQPMLATEGDTEPVAVVSRVSVGGPPIRACSRHMNVDSDRHSPPCALVIFGASGDLTARKLLPALERLSGYGGPPPEVACIGVARTPMTDDEFRDYCRERVTGTETPRWAHLTAGARYVAGAYDDP